MRLPDFNKSALEGDKFVSPTHRPPLPPKEIFLALYADKALFQSKLVSGRSKLKLYQTVIRPVVVYGCETWVLKENIFQKLSVFERKILRRIFGPIKNKDGSWKIKTNMELDKLIQYRNVINYVKA